MKKLILILLFIPLVFSCDKEGVNDPLIYSIEGKINITVQQTQLKTQLKIE